MIIRSNFNDYYDFVAHQYRDNKIVYQRETIKWGRRHQNTPKELMAAKQELSFGIWQSPAKYEGEDIDAVIIGGKVYQYHHEMKSQPYGETQHIFNNSKEKIHEAATNGFRKYFRGSFRQYDWGEHVPKFNDLCIEFGPIIWFHDYGIDINPKFKDDKYLMNILDAYTMVQDIMACIGSIEPHVPEMNDTTKVEAAGFDKVESFRHRK